MPSPKPKRTPDDKRKQRTKTNHVEMRAAFVREFLADPTDASAALIRAGYSDKGAKQTASRLLTEPDIIEQLRLAREAAMKRTEITVDYVLRNLQENLERCMQHVPVKDAKGHEIPGEWTHNAKEANKALELMGKYLGMFIDRKKLEIDGPPRKVVINVGWRRKNGAKILPAHLAQNQLPAPGTTEGGAENS